MAGPLTKVGRYQIVGELGRGSMGVVYQGFDPVIGRTIAIKTMLTEGLSAAEFQEYKARFQREAQTAGVLSHPNIVTVYDFGEESGVLYLAMECLDGESLEKIVEARNLLPLDTVIPVYDQVCSALDHAHAHGVVHRDIKPGNIMILSNGQVKVTDFGIAKMMAAGMTQAGQILGTPNYMSPEQVKGRPVDGRSDIFSLGVILYELITGEKPFGGQNITTVIYKIINENPIPPRELDSAIHPGLSYVTSKALAKSPGDRYQTCRQLAEDLRNYKNLAVSPIPSATVVLRGPQVAASPPEPVADKVAETELTPFQAAEPSPARPLKVQVIPPVKPQREGSSATTWTLLVLLVMAGLGAGYYFYFMGNPSKVAGNPTAQPGVQAPAPSPPALKIGGLSVASNVPEAKISIDGRNDPDWITPHTFSDLPAGPHVVAISKDGYNDAQQTVTVEDGHTSPLTLDLEAKAAKVDEVAPQAVPKLPPAPKLGQLIVTANVAGAKISIDGHSEPDWVTPHTFPELPAGARLVSITKEGYNGASRSVTIAGGRTTSMNATLSVPSGEINIVTSPPGAEVTIDGRVMGASPVRATVRAGQHTYTARLPGRPPEEGAFTLKEGLILTKQITWSEEPAGPSGVVEVRTIPPGATVSADGAPLGDKTPTNLRLTVGRHTLTLSLSGFEVAEREIDVPADDSTPVKVYVTLSRQ